MAGLCRDHSSGSTVIRWLTSQIGDELLTLYVGYATRLGAPIEHHRTVTVDFFNNATFEGAEEDSLFTIVPNAAFPGEDRAEL